LADFLGRPIFWRVFFGGFFADFFAGTFGGTFGGFFGGPIFCVRSNRVGRLFSSLETWSHQAKEKNC
jgi:hypothetical protein